MPYHAACSTPPAHPAGRRFLGARSGGGRGAWGRHACAAPTPQHPGPPGPPLQQRKSDLVNQRRSRCRRGSTKRASKAAWQAGPATIITKACRLPPTNPKPPTCDRQPNHGAGVREVEAQAVAACRGVRAQQRRLAVHVAAKDQGAGVRGAGEVPRQHRPAAQVGQVAAEAVRVSSASAAFLLRSSVRAATSVQARAARWPAPS